MGLLRSFDTYSRNKDTELSYVLDSLRAFAAASRAPFLTILLLIGWHTSPIIFTFSVTCAVNMQAKALLVGDPTCSWQTAFANLHDRADINKQDGQSLAFERVTPGMVSLPLFLTTRILLPLEIGCLYWNRTFSST